MVSILKVEPRYSSSEFDYILDVSLILQQHTVQTRPGGQTIMLEPSPQHFSFSLPIKNEHLTQHLPVCIFWIGREPSIQRVKKENDLITDYQIKLPARLDLSRNHCAISLIPLRRSSGAIEVNALFSDSSTNGTTLNKAEIVVAGQKQLKINFFVNSGKDLVYLPNGSILQFSHVSNDDRRPLCELKFHYTVNVIRKPIIQQPVQPHPLPESLKFFISIRNNIVGEKDFRRTIPYSIPLHEKEVNVAKLQKIIYVGTEKSDANHVRLPENSFVDRVHGRLTVLARRSAFGEAEAVFFYTDDSVYGTWFDDSDALLPKTKKNIGAMLLSRARPTRLFSGTILGFGRLSSEDNRPAFEVRLDYSFV
ncbi:hypothetical protein HZB00_00770 [Candidatus Woesearchaeota archaeon]|nr:hypothetical protein [Candidatus Woesearchaeota archaeon]